MSTTETKDTCAQVTNFIRNIIDEDLERGANQPRLWCGHPAPYSEQIAGVADPARIRTRFPPEPNGYLHIGHAKSICLNFGLARDYQGYCHMRFDDTNPVKEDVEYVDAIKEDIHWLGFDWGDRFFYGSDYFEKTYELAVEFLQLELERTQALKCKTLVLHPGAHVGAGADVGIRQIIKGLNEVFSQDKDGKVNIALETMAGKGTEIGRSFEEIAAIYDGVTYNERLRVCFDTCHTSDAGYDVREDFASVIEQFDRIIGKDQIAVFHINDSKNPQGAHKDRHENIGFGEIGYDCLRNIVYNKDFEAIPKILETPYIPNPETKKRAFAPYKYEIAMLREGAFHEDLKEKILEGNK